MLVEENGVYIFPEDYLFGSPSSAVLLF
ncbi:MAG: DUF4357 domain-containing protein [Bacteroidetes bacterium]|nr:DUF4357 domain-containing protein [Bacteroidota bacterium]